MEIKFKNLKEMEKEIEALNADKAKVESRAIKDIIDGQIKEIHRVYELRKEQILGVDFDTVDKKKEKKKYNIVVQCVDIDYCTSGNSYLDGRELPVTIGYFMLDDNHRVVMEGTIKLRSITSASKEEGLMEAAKRVLEGIFF